MDDNKYLPLHNLFSESLVRDLVLFSILFLLVIAQVWTNIFLLLFPLITFAFSLFFHMISINKWRSEFDDTPIVYNPLGLEKKHANRFGFCSLLQMILLFWIGAESFYHPQLIDNYTILFLIIFVFFYTFCFYWIFIDLWKYSRIYVIFDGLNVSELKRMEGNTSEDIDKIVSFLNLKSHNMISYISLIIFIIMNSINAFIVLLSNFGFLVPVEFQYYLPGTGTEESDPINISAFMYLVLILPPVITVLLLSITYHDVNTINHDRLNSVLKNLPQQIKINVIENLKAFNKRLKEDLKLE